jgi:hypothetical protein
VSDVVWAQKRDKLRVEVKCELTVKQDEDLGEMRDMPG